MSVEILLVPAALAGLSALASAWAAGSALFTNDEGQRVCVVQTRFKHTGLLAQSLTNLGVRGVEVDGETVTGLWGDNPVAFSRNTGVWGEPPVEVDGVLACNFEGEIENDEAAARIQSLDSEYARLVQQQVRERVLARAGKLGMTVESETVDDEEGITLVLNVER